jgi:exonuclease III
MVMVMVQDQMGTPTLVDTSSHTDLNGHLTHVTLEDGKGHPPLHLVGVYAPNDDASVRHAIYKYLAHVAQTCQEEGCTLIAGGDWNATWQPEDRGGRHKWVPG